MKTSDMFSDLGYAYIRNVLTTEQCERFHTLLLEMKNNQTLGYEGGPNSFYNESYGGNNPEFEEALRLVQPRIEEELKVSLKPANSFGRIYYNGGTLDTHVDRSGLDYTLSITIKSTLSEDWPLWCTDLKGTNVPLYIAQGDGGIMYGTKMSHWRTPLVCEPNQYFAALFFHWTFA